MAPFLPPALRDWGNHFFCHLDWHMSNTVIVYFADAPTPLSLQDRHESISINQEALQAAIKTMQLDGWQIIRQQPNQEGRQYTLMRVPALDAGYEYVVMTSLMTPQTKTLRLDDLYQLGHKNEYLLLNKRNPLNPPPMETEAYLAAQGWQRVRVDSYPYYGRQDSQHEVHLFRKKVQKVWWRLW